MNLPVDFEKMVRLPAAINGAGYPYRISAKDLMMNFRACALEVDEEQHDCGLRLEETGTYNQRKVKLSGELNGAATHFIVATCDDTSSLIEMIFSKGLLVDVVIGGGKPVGGWPTSAVVIRPVQCTAAPGP